MTVWHSPAAHRAHYAGLQTCGSVWQCPPCAVRITEGRRSELERAFAIWTGAGGRLGFLTLTRRHTSAEALPAVLDAFLAARREMLRDRSFRAWVGRWGVVGSITALEVTFGANGAHVHAHAALPVGPGAAFDAEAARGELLAIWRHAGLRRGFSMSDARGLDLQESAGALADYLAKVGHAPAPGRRAWGVEDELTKAISKRSKGGETPFDLLRRAGETGEVDAIARFREFAGCFKGKRQLVWSPGLRRRLHELDGSFGVTERSDAELAAERISRGDVLLAALTDRQWDAVRRLDRRSALLDVADRGDGGALAAWLSGLVVECERGGGDGQGL